MIGLPAPELRDEIHFVFVKDLSYGQRLALIAFALAGGLWTQFFGNFWFGLAALFVGTMLGVVHGYSDKPKLLLSDEKWDQVTPDEYKKVREREKQLWRWDIDLFDASNLLGGAAFLAVIGGSAAGLYYLMSRGEPNLAMGLLLDVIVVLSPHWVTGTRSYLTRNKLITKITLLESVMARLSRLSDVQALPMLSTLPAAEGGRVPEDARLMVRLLNAPETFMGMQVQISINTVQGTDYPYLYCVLLAKKGAGYFNVPGALVPRADGALIEPSPSPEVDVIVVRQATTQTSGYCTDEKDAGRVVDRALEIALKLARAKKMG